MSKFIAAAKSFVREEEGAAMVEYALLVGLIAVTSIIVIGLLGDNIHRVFDVTNDEVTKVVPLPKP